MTLRTILAETRDFIHQIYVNKDLILELTRHDFLNKYIKNYLGIVWAIFEPLAFILILYFVFSVQFGSSDVEGTPYVAYLITGYIAFNFFSATLEQATDSISAYSFMLNKVNFRVAILPLVKILSNLMLHAVILVIAVIFLLFNHVYPSWYWLQVFYYILSLFAFLLGLAWITSSVSLFFPDLKNIISIVTMLLFFLTPVFWYTWGFSETYVNILKLNPLYYIVNGYRDSFLFQVGFWKHPVLTPYFWGLTFLFLVIGTMVFKKLRPHFADVV
ncbi:MAG TPA: ABC transporter permease [Bacteroidales bacterium]|nr:ABC transporter permease [Bacteroidales bacterium]HNS47855.1 ABC transporter permease [Bacteroidales bacterium]